MWLCSTRWIWWCRAFSETWTMRTFWWRSRHSLLKTQVWVRSQARDWKLLLTFSVNGRCPPPSGTPETNKPSCTSTCCTGCSGGTRSASSFMRLQKVRHWFTKRLGADFITSWPMKWLARWGSILTFGSQAPGWQWSIRSSSTGDITGMRTKKRKSGASSEWAITCYSRTVSILRLPR